MKKGAMLVKHSFFFERACRLYEGDKNDEWKRECHVLLRVAKREGQGGRAGKAGR